MRINEIFYSLQGEGYYAGRAAVFVRFSGCNLRCPFCDTDFSSFSEMTEDEVVEKVLSFSCPFVVLTGGEPTLQLTKSLVAKLHSAGLYLSMETNGTRPEPCAWVDWVTVSPKSAFVAGAEPKVQSADEIKVVFDGVHKVSDYGIKAGHHFIQPCDTGNEKRNTEILAESVAFVKSNPDWRLSLQQHKIIGIR